MSTLVTSNIKHSGSASNNVELDSSGNLKFNSGYGSAAVSYGCRAWVNFNGTGTVAIRSSGNVSSITDNGTGLYTVNFTNAMPDAEYAVTIAGRKNDGNDDGNFISAYGNTNRLPTTTSCPISTAFVALALQDFPSISVTIFR
jgi:hypothetical protein